MTNIGEKIKELRNKQKMTQEKLAQYLNVTVSAVSQWESGKTMPDVTMIVPLCNLFEISADKLLNIRVAEKGTIISEVKNKVFALTEQGDYDKAIVLVKEKIREFPNEIEFLIMFAQLVMDFDKKVDGRIEDKEDLCQELYDTVIKDNALAKWKEKDSYDHDLDIEIMVFVTKSLVSRNICNNSRKIRKQVDELIGSKYTQTSKTELLKIVEDQREVGGAASRLISYEVIVYLMKSGLEEYRITHNEALLKEIIAHGDNFLQCNSSLHYYFDCLRYLIEATKAIGDSTDKYLDLLKSAKREIESIVG